MEDIEIDDDDNTLDPERQYGGWPPTEKQAYDYCKKVKALTSAQMFIQALGFLQGVFGFMFEPIFRSSRILCVAAMKLGKMGPIRKAKAATNYTIPKLEVAVC